MNRTFVRVAVALALTLLPGSIAQSYNFYTPPRRWLGVPRRVTVDARGISSVNDPNHGVGAALVAANDWNSVGAGSLIDARQGTVVPVLGDRISDVVFGDPFGFCTGSCLAATTIAYYSTSQWINCSGQAVFGYFDSDVVFNLNHQWTTVAETDGCSNEFYLEAVMSHEIGHLLGLAHTNDSSALMYPFLSSCFNKPIATDDVLGARALYNCPPPPGPGGGCEGRAYSPEGGPPHCH